MASKETTRRLLEYFWRNGLVRAPNPVRLAEPLRKYKKGHEVRLTAFNLDELRDIRALLEAAGFVPLAEPFAKSRRWIQPVYGKPAVDWFRQTPPPAASRPAKPKKAP